MAHMFWHALCMTCPQHRIRLRVARCGDGPHTQVYTLRESPFVTSYPVNPSLPLLVYDAAALWYSDDPQLARHPLLNGTFPAEPLAGRLDPQEYNWAVYDSSWDYKTGVFNLTKKPTGNFLQV